MKSFLKHQWALLPVLLLATACGTSRHAMAPAGKTAAETSAAAAAAAYERKVLANAQTVECLTAKLGNIKLNGKGIPLGSGELRMKRGDVVQLIVSVPLLGEVGRMEFTADGLLVVDRMHKEYVRVPYERVPFLQAAGLDFSSLEALFWNEIFVPGQAALRSATGLFSLSESGDHTLLSLKSAPKLNYYFLTVTEDGRLDRTNITAKTAADPTEFTWRYSRFDRFKGHPFPGAMQLDVTGIKHPVSLGFDLSSLGSNDNWTTRTTVPSKYRERSIDDVLGQLGRLTGQ